MSNLEQLSQKDFFKAKQIFTQAIALDKDLIEPYVTEQCEGNADMISAVMSLVNMHLDSGEATITPKKPISELINHEVSIAVGQKIDKFVIEKPLGSGGMGDVYLAKRSDDQVQQQVAIKVLKNKLNQSAFERFQTEKRLLAHLEHPGIARLIDAGVTDDGMTYYVMEYVEGQPINDYCQQQQLTVKQRLRLFMEVCEVVSYAHSNLIIHRDLKPQNILVTDKGQVKLLDFGIAKPLQDLPGMENRQETIQGSFALTPQYAAPEQFTDGVIGTACDVYALGLLLYELLTGKLAQDLTGLSLFEMEKVITDKVFINASKQVTQQDIDTSQFQLKNPAHFKSLLKGDIDSIINKAIKKEPQQRYKSVADLAQDIDNHLNFKPISVRGNQQAYRLKKYLRRNWLAASAAIGIVTILSLSTYFVSLERDKAIAEKQLAEEVSSFLVSTFKNADPTKTQGEKITAKEILEEGVRQINNQQDSQIKDKLLLTMGEVYFELAEAKKALLLINQATRESGDLILLRAKIYKFEGDYQKALREIDKYTYQVGTESELKYINNKSQILSSIDEKKKSKEMGNIMLSKASSLFGNNSTDYADYLMKFTELAPDHSYRKRNVENYSKIIQIYEDHNMLNHPQLALAHFQLSSSYKSLTKYNLSMDHLNQSDEIYNRIYDENHLIISRQLNSRAALNKLLGDYDSAIKNYARSIEIKKKYYGSETDFRIAAGYFNLGLVYLYHGPDFEKAKELFEIAINLLEPKRVEKIVMYSHFQRFLCVALIATKKYEEAKLILSELIPFYEKRNTKVGLNLAESRALLAKIFFEEGKIDESKHLIELSIHILKENNDKNQYMRMWAEKVHEKLNLNY